MVLTKILFVGRFEPRKGLKYLLQAFPIILKEFPSAKLIIVGAGVLERYYKIYIEEHIKRQVIFAGSVSPDDLPKYYASCDIFCSPATGQEAMSSGKPIVASDNPGYKTVMQDGEEGVFSKTTDVQSLAKKVISLLKDKKKMKRMGVKGRAKALTYDWQIITKKVFDFYTEVLNSGD